MDSPSPSPDHTRHLSLPTTEKSPEDVIGEPEEEHVGEGAWKDASFHGATITATPAAYAPLPFAPSSLGWGFGSFTGNNIAIQIAGGSSLKVDLLHCLRLFTNTIMRERIHRSSLSYDLPETSASETFKAFNALVLLPFVFYMQCF